MQLCHDNISKSDVSHIVVGTMSRLAIGDVGVYPTLIDHSRNTLQIVHFKNASCGDINTRSMTVTVEYGIPRLLSNTLA